MSDVSVVLAGAAAHNHVRDVNKQSEQSLTQIFYQLTKFFIRNLPTMGMSICYIKHKEEMAL